MNRRKFITASALSLLVLGGCDSKEGTKSAVGSGMKCGAGKCGANMFDGNLALGKKKKNILDQMREGDTRKDCVLQAGSTKDLYNCVRDPKSKKLSLKCAADKCGSKKEQAKMPMKCGAGKCGSSMGEKKKEPKKEAAMKCGAGKCGSAK